MTGSTRGQHKTIADSLILLGHDSRAARLAALTEITGRPVPVFAALSFEDAADVIAELGQRLARTASPREGDSDG